MPGQSFFRCSSALAATVFVGAACGGDITLPPATIANTIDTVELWALNDTPIGTPSGLDLVTALEIRPELGAPFDLAFDIDSAGTARLIQSSVLGLGGIAGLQETDRAFEDVLRAPVEDFVTDVPFALTVGDVLVARSRSTSGGCSVLIGSLPRYAKIEVLAIDAVARTVSLQIMVNLNCGYRDLVEGVPDQ
jgi:hypothetical protein